MFKKKSHGLNSDEGHISKKKKKKKKHVGIQELKVQGLSRKGSSWRHLGLGATRHSPAAPNLYYQFIKNCKYKRKQKKKAQTKNVIS